ncbi:MAG TPA: aminodeoxychorismate synthase component I [Armatimonadota bacterium]|jgi:para-aminobenzoate synthetase/4-amino-4-deoxychorismate lyase
MPSDMRPNSVILHDAGLTGRPRWLAFRDPVACVTARAVAQVRPALQRVEAEVAAGYFAAGFLSYEAAPAFDAALHAHRPGVLPLLWFGIYRMAEEVPPPAATMGQAYMVSPWHADLNAEAYRTGIKRIKDSIARGETYQVNYTMRLSAHFTGDAWSFFADLVRAQQARYCAYIDLGDHVLCSASPELFFQRSGNEITCRPMKGTAARGLSSGEDLAQASWLRASTKNRAENVMIVDMMRNDLGRIADPGSVRVTSLFDVEQYDTLWQMTSSVTARSHATLGDIFGALFPCASITGAPKVRTSQIIAALEPTPREIYTGCMGFVAPNGDAQFNVAIRTAHLETRTGRMVYGTGGGITWGSDEAEEYAECQTKTRVLTERRPVFQLLETLLWKPGAGYFLLDYHLQRLADSARYFGISINLQALQEALYALTPGLTQRHRVRLLVDEAGQARTEATPIVASPIRRWRVRLAEHPIEQQERFLYHKTTQRACYDGARAAAPGYDDVLLWNISGEITESTIANVVLRRQGGLMTPPLSCGVLPGTYRAHLLATGRINEGIITIDELATAEAIYLINAVRGWIPVQYTHGASRDQVKV